MDLFMVIFRLLHIVAGIIWVGAAFTMVLFIGPTAEGMGPQAGSFMMNLFAKSMYIRGVIASAIVTVIAGLALYDKVTDHLGDGDFISSTKGVVLTIGVIAGLLAAGHGIGATGQLAKKYAALAKTVLAAGGAPTPEQGAEFGQLAAKIKTNSRITAALMIVAVVCMAGWRYV